MKLYRFLTGPDDAAFCRRVSEALAEGWALHGSPALTFNGERVICGQAVVKDVADPVDGLAPAAGEAEDLP